MTRWVVSTDRLAPAIGPSSQAVLVNGLLYSSGQVGIDPLSGNLVPGGVENQTRQCLSNVRTILEAAGRSLADVVKVNVYLADMTDFAAMNSAYAEHFAKPYPARTTIEVAGLPLGALVEIEIIAQ